MRKLLCLSLLLILGLGVVGCGDSKRPLPQQTSQFAFIREAASGAPAQAAALPHQLNAWSHHYRGQKALKAHRGRGMVPFATDIDPGTDSVVLMKVDGTENVIANQAGYFYSVQLSAGGKKGVFSADSLGYTQVFKVDLSNLSNPVVNQLTTDPEDHGWPQLSPDGSQVIFMKWVGEIVQTAIMSSSGGVETVLSTPAHWTLAPNFTPGGNIIFGDDYTGIVMMMKSDGTGMHALTAPDATSWDSFPSTSADGKTIVFNRNGDIFTQLMDGTGLRQLTTDSLSWDAMFVANKIIFVSYQDGVGSGEIYSMNPDGTSRTRLTNNSVDEYFVYD
ncbi:MAG TPA: hypothetical protein VJQ82_19285 [Terriglobales bacterium]|nr:hypothetical protein [Terriglobales bacterium]